MFGLWTLLGTRNEGGHNSTSAAVMIAPDFFNAFMTKLRLGESFKSEMIKAIQELKAKSAFIFSICASNHWAVAFVANGLDREDGSIEYFYLPIDSQYSDVVFQSLYSDCIDAIQSFLLVVHGCEMQKSKIELMGVHGQSEKVDQGITISSKGSQEGIGVHGQLHCFDTDVVEANGTVPVRPSPLVLSLKRFVGMSPVSVYNNTLVDEVLRLICLLCSR